MFEIDPAAARRGRLAFDGHSLPGGKAQNIGAAWQRGVGRPGLEHFGQALRAGLGILAAGSLFKLQRIEHQCKHDGQRDHVECPELVLEG